MAQTDDAATGVVVVEGGSGHTVIERNSSLKRLHYFDGKLLRAPDMQLEQQALLAQIRLANQAGGSGVVHGFDCVLDSADGLRIGAGLAFDGQGRVLQLGGELRLPIAGLLAKSTSTTGGGDARACAGKAVFGDCEQPAGVTEPDTVREPGSLYLITIHYAEAYCGEEDVYGKLCEEACVSSTQRPYVLPGIEVRAVPLNLPLPLQQSTAVALSGRHLRSRVASAYFEQERQQGRSHISREGLGSMIWCLGAEAAGGNGVPIAVLARAGSKTLFLDAWTARRERMEAPPRHYWAGRMAMRSWPQFLAQVLQFQCQLSHCLSHGSQTPEVDPCAEERSAAAEAAAELKRLLEQYEKVAERLATLELGENSTLSTTRIRDSYARLAMLGAAKLPLSTRWLIDNCGIVELPSAGYLPVDNTAAHSVNEQVRRLMGEGVDLRFCVVRPDYIPHALEEAQHMERISLLEGLDDPASKPRVDVLVPEGTIEAHQAQVPGTGYEMDIAIASDLLPAGIQAGSVKGTASYEGEPVGGYTANLTAREPWTGAGITATYEEPPAEEFVSGAARGERLENGGYAFHYAGRMPSLVKRLAQRIAPAMMAMASNVTAATGTGDTGDNGDVNTVVPRGDLWFTFRCDRDPFALGQGARIPVSVEITAAFDVRTTDGLTTVLLEITQQGELIVGQVLAPAPETRLSCTLNSNGMVAIRTEGVNTESHAIPLRLSEQLYLTRDAGSALGFKLSIPRVAAVDKFDNERNDADLGLTVERRWVSANEAELKVTASFKAIYRRYRKETDYAQTWVAQWEKSIAARQVVNPQVLNPGHRLHDTSLVALRELADAMDDGSFVDPRARLLFPPPQLVPRELRIFAKRDWVMFHRRRDIRCEQEAAPEPILERRRYRLLHVDTLSSREQLEAYRDALLNNRGDVLSKFDYEEVALVEFEAGLPAVLNSHSALRSDWRDEVRNDQAEIMLAAIASRGQAYDEGAVLGRLRLQGLTDVLSPVTALDEEGRQYHLPKVPDVFAEGDADGVIIIVTAAVAKVCHEVHVARLGGDVLGIFAEEIGSYDDFRRAFAEHKVDYLSDIEFTSGTRDMTAAAASRLTQLAETLNAVPYFTLLLSTEGDDSQPYEQQHMAIARGLGVVADGPGITANPQSGFEQCGAVSVLVVSPQAPEPGALRAIIPDYYQVGSVAVERLVDLKFDDTGGLTEDAYAQATQPLAEKDIFLAGVEVLKLEGMTEQQVEDVAAKANQLLTRLQKDGLAQPSAIVSTREPGDKEKALIGTAAGGLFLRPEQ